MSRTALIYQRSARLSGPGSAPLCLSRCLSVSRFAMPVPGVFTTRATTPGASHFMQSGSRSPSSLLVFCGPGPGDHGGADGRHVPPSSGAGRFRGNPGPGGYPQTGPEIQTRDIAASTRILAVRSTV